MCAFGQEYDCGKSQIDRIFIDGEHLLSDLARTIIRIETPLRTSRTSNGHPRYPVVKYDLETGKFTLDGKRCRPAKTKANQ
jgi:hypothetical protein